MRIEFYGLVFDTPLVTFHLWTPWRASALEHRLFEAVRALPRMQAEQGPDELVIHLTEPKSLQAALKAVSRVLKGWQEEAEPGSERRNWRWLLEGDANQDGYDHNGDRLSVWAFLRASIERGGVGEGDKGEDIDLEGFSMRIWGQRGGA